MAKRVEDQRLAINLELTRKDTTSPVAVRGVAEYQVSSDDLMVTRLLKLDLSTAQEDAIKEFGASVLQQIKNSER